MLRWGGERNSFVESVRRIVVLVYPGTARKRPRVLAIRCRTALLFFISWFLLKMGHVKESCPAAILVSHVAQRCR